MPQFGTFYKALTFVIFGIILILSGIFLLQLRALILALILLVTGIFLLIFGFYYQELYSEEGTSKDES